MSVDLEPYRAAIVSAFPDLERASLRPLTMGWHSLAIEADGRLVFKFPRGEEAERALRREARLLAALRPHLTLPVPDLDLVEAPVLFSRHAKIPGEHLVTDQYQRLPRAARERRPRRRPRRSLPRSSGSTSRSASPPRRCAGPSRRRRGARSWRRGSASSARTS